jgi:hypothetical protein
MFPCFSAALHLQREGKGAGRLSNKEGLIRLEPRPMKLRPHFVKFKFSRIVMGKQ